MGLFDKVNVGSVLGGTAGFMLGGPWGAAAGASLGNGLVGASQGGKAPSPAAAGITPYSPTGQAVKAGQVPQTQYMQGETLRQPISQYDETSGMPLIAPYASSRGKDGALLAPYQVQAGNLGDANAWGDLMQGKVQMQTARAVDDARQASQSATQNAWSDLAMQGGLSSGARERIATSGARDAMMGAQDARAQGSLNSLEAMLQTENLNRDASKFNIGNQFQASQINAGSALDDLKGFNTQNQISYQERMKDFTGSKMAQAMAAAGGGNGGANSGWGKLLSNLTFGIL